MSKVGVRLGWVKSVLGRFGPSWVESSWGGVNSGSGQVKSGQVGFGSEPKPNFEWNLSGVESELGQVGVCLGQVRVGSV